MLCTNCTYTLKTCLTPQNSIANKDVYIQIALILQQNRTAEKYKSFHLHNLLIDQIIRRNIALWFYCL